MLKNIIKLLQNTQYAHFRTAVLFCLFLAGCAALFLFLYGKTHSFILINGYYNPALNVFFSWATWLGDGIIYVPIVLYCIIFNRKFFLPVVFGILIATFLTHFLKRIVFPGELRPISLEAQKIIIHKVPGVAMNREHSFPSGHTGTAFSMALLLVTVMKRRVWAFILPMVAFFVGYSRIYLGQHYVTDVLAGMCVGIVTAFLSLWLYDLYLKKRNKASVEVEEPTI